MNGYYHSVTLNEDKCKGCTNCIKRCPTMAIRVRKRRAKIIKERCIDCGECIRVCPYHAKKAVTDDFSAFSDYKYNIALVAPAFYGQFRKETSADMLLSALLQLGFDSTYDVALGAELVTEKTKELLKERKIEKPVISSACPAVVRLITVRFPDLLPHIIPLRSPMEVAAQAARKEAAEATGFKPEEIGIFFISPCAAKVTSVKSSITVNSSAVSGVISMNDICLRIADIIGKNYLKTQTCNAGSEGIMWATSGGEADATGVKRHIAVDEIHNVINVLEDIENDKLRDIEYVEALACPSGCVGGPLTVENSFVARSRIKMITENMPQKGNAVSDGIKIEWDKEPKRSTVMYLHENMATALEMANRIEQILEDSPQLDCGSCGSPSCRDLAEDIVRGFASETDCIFKFKEKMGALSREMCENEKDDNKTDKI